MVKEEKLDKWKKEFTDNIERIKSLHLLATKRKKNDPANDGCIRML